jgi:preprotein translocase subunit Sss1
MAVAVPVVLIVVVTMVVVGTIGYVIDNGTRD